MKDKKWWIVAQCGKQRLGFKVSADNLVDAIDEGTKVAQTVSAEYEVVSVDEIRK